MSHDNHSTIQEYEDSGIAQPFHLVRPSVWPFIVAMCAGVMMALGVMYMHKDKIHLGGMEINLGIKGVVLGFAAVAAVAFMWWRDIIHEAFVEKAHSPVVKKGLHFGMALFISSEVMFFVAFFWAYFSAALFPPAILGGVWPPANIPTADPFDMPFFMTLILLLSGTTVTWAHGAVLANNRRDLIRALTLTVLLGMSFTVCQAIEYAHTDFNLNSGMFGSTFFMATGFHGFHVIIGTIFLAVCLWRAGRGQFSADQHFGLTAAAWYWHFVDVVWALPLFCHLHLRITLMYEFRPRLWPTISTLVMVALLGVLGTWQLQRLHWKNALVATIDQHIHAASQDVETFANADEANYHPATASGIFLNDHPLFMLAISKDGQGGYHVLTLLNWMMASCYWWTGGGFPMTIVIIFRWCMGVWLSRGFCARPNITGFCRAMIPRKTTGIRSTLPPWHRLRV